MSKSVPEDASALCAGAKRDPFVRGAGGISFSLRMGVGGVATGILFVRFGGGGKEVAGSVGTVFTFSGLGR